MRRPRIALIAWDVRGDQGSGRVIAELIRRGDGRAEFLIVSRSLDPQLRPLVRWLHVPAPENPLKARLGAFLVTGTVLSAMARADILHGHAIGPLVANRLDLLTVHFSREGFYRAAGTLSSASTRAHATLERWCFRRARALAALSEGSATELRARFPEKTVIVTPNGVDADRFRPDDGVRTRIRGDLEIPADRVVALFVANSWRQKGLAVVIEALAAARAPTLELWVVGYGDENRYRELARAREVADRVRFLGLSRDVAPYYAAADIFVLPSFYEQMSLAAHEAAAAGLPIVATPVHGMEELVGENAAGALVERDPSAVGAALARLAADASLRERQGREARRRAAERTWDRSVDAVFDLYRRLLRRPDLSFD